VAPVDDPALHPRLQSLLETCLADNRQAWDLEPDGTWRQRTPVGEQRATHSILMADSWGRAAPGIPREWPYKSQGLVEGRESSFTGDD
jgi:polyphosphate kinase